MSTKTTAPRKTTIPPEVPNFKFERQAAAIDRAKRRASESLEGATLSAQSRKASNEIRACTAAGAGGSSAVIGVRMVAGATAFFEMLAAVRAKEEADWSAFQATEGEVADPCDYVAVAQQMKTSLAQGLSSDDPMWLEGFLRALAAFVVPAAEGVTDPADSAATSLETTERAFHAKAHAEEDEAQPGRANGDEMSESEASALFEQFRSSAPLITNAQMHKIEGFCSEQKSSGIPRRALLGMARFSGGELLEKAKDRPTAVVMAMMMLVAEDWLAREKNLVEICDSAAFRMRMSLMERSDMEAILAEAEASIA